MVTYGISTHPNDPNRNLMLLNFYLDENLQTGKEIIDGFLAHDTTKFISNFRDVVFEPPDPTDRSAITRFNRRVLFYRALLFKAGYTPPSGLSPQTRGLFNQDLLNAMQNGQGQDAQAYANCATMLSKPQPAWGEIAQCGSMSPRLHKGYWFGVCPVRCKLCSNKQQLDRGPKTTCEKFLNYSPIQTALGKLAESRTDTPPALRLITRMIFMNTCSRAAS